MEVIKMIKLLLRLFRGRPKRNSEKIRQKLIDEWI